MGSSNFGKQIEYMYVNGYDFRQFIVTSIPMSIMEVLMRVFYVAKQVSLGKGAFGETLLDTMPLRLNPRFRMMLARVMELPVLLTQVKCISPAIFSMRITPPGWGWPEWFSLTQVVPLSATLKALGRY